MAVAPNLTNALYNLEETIITMHPPPEIIKAIFKAEEDALKDPEAKKRVKIFFRSIFEKKHFDIRGASIKDTKLQNVLDIILDSETCSNIFSAIRMIIVMRTKEDDEIYEVATLSLISMEPFQETWVLASFFPLESSKSGAGNYRAYFTDKIFDAVMAACYTMHVLARRDKLPFPITCLLVCQEIPDFYSQAGKFKKFEAADTYTPLQKRTCYATSYSNIRAYIREKLINLAGSVIALTFTTITSGFTLFLFLNYDFMINFSYAAGQMGAVLLFGIGKYSVQVMQAGGPVGFVVCGMALLAVLLWMLRKKFTRSSTPSGQESLCGAKQKTFHEGGLIGLIKKTHNALMNLRSKKNATVATFTSADIDAFVLDIPHAPDAGGQAAEGGGAGAAVPPGVLPAPAPPGEADLEDLETRYAALIHDPGHGGGAGAAVPPALPHVAPSPPVEADLEAQLTVPAPGHSNKRVGEDNKRDGKRRRTGPADDDDKNGSWRSMTFRGRNQMAQFRKALQKSPEMRRQFSEIVPFNFSWDDVNQLTFTKHKGDHKPLVYYRQ